MIAPVRSNGRCLSAMAVTETLTLESAHLRGFALVQDHTGRFVAYIEGLGDENLGRRITGSDWTVGETIAHLQSVYLRYTTDRRRAPSPQGVAEQNAAGSTASGPVP